MLDFFNIHINYFLGTLMLKEDQVKVPMTEMTGPFVQLVAGTNHIWWQMRLEKAKIRLSKLSC